MTPAGREPEDRPGAARPPASEKEKMLAGKLYNASDPELVALRARARELLDRLDALGCARQAERREVLGRLLGSCGASPAVEAGFRCDYGCNIHVGDNLEANFNCTILDVCEVRIGDGCLIGPGVVITAATHPVNPALRAAHLELGRPVTIGNNVWIGASAVINPGVRVGDNAVVGAGAVVTRDVPANAVVAGCPARVIRFVGEGASGERPGDGEAA